MSGLFGVVFHFFFILPIMWFFSFAQAVASAFGLLPSLPSPASSDLAAKVVLEDDQRELASEFNNADSVDDKARLMHILDHMKRSLSDETLLDHLDEATALLKRDGGLGIIDDSTPSPRLSSSSLAAVTAGSRSTVASSSNPTRLSIPPRPPASDASSTSPSPRMSTPTYRPAPLFVPGPDEMLGSRTSQETPATSPSGDGSPAAEETTNINAASFFSAATPGVALSWIGARLWRIMPDVMWAWSTPAEVPEPAARDAILDGVLSSRKVIAVARQMGLTRSERHRQVRAILNTMVAVQNLRVIRIMAWIMKKLWGYLYPFGIHVKEEEVDMLHRYAGRAPFVIVPTHKSHIDYLLFTYLCFARGLPIPHVVAGINLNILFVGPILRWGGAFFIRRSFAGDLLYHAVFDAYVTQLLVSGASVECFIEGGRSRSGKVLPPKSGFLKVVIDAVVEGDVADALIVPVSLNYDRIVENDSHIKELSGSEKNAEQLLGFLSASFTLLYRILSGKICLGSVDIGIGQPISVKQFVVDAALKLETRHACDVVAASLRQPSLTNMQILRELDVPVRDIVTRGVPLAPMASLPVRLDDSEVRPSDSDDDSEPGTASESSSDTDSDDELEPQAEPAANASACDGSSSAEGPSLKRMLSALSPEAQSALSGVKKPDAPLRAATFPSPSAQSPEGGLLALAAPPTPRSLDKNSSEARALVAALTAHQRKRITFSLGYTTLYACNTSSVVLPAALVGTVLLTHYTRGMRYSELVQKVKWLRREVNERGGRVESRDGASLSKSITTVLDRVLQRGGRNRGLVKLHKDIVMLSLYSPQERMELSLYRNQLIHNFVPESLLLCSMYAFEKAAGALVAVEESDLLVTTRFLSSLLKREFIFKPSPGAGHNFAEIVARLLDRGVLLRTDDGMLTVNDYDLYARTGDAPGTAHDEHDASRGTSMYLFLAALLWPFIDSYWLAALSLYHLYPDRNVSSKDLINYTQKLGERLYFEGQIDLYEAVSKETVGNAIKLFMEKGVVEAVHVQNQFTTAPIVRLTKDYHSMAAIDSLIRNAITTTDIDDGIAIVRRHEGIAAE
ncbi:uncharacterized protein AMSG_10399 [Thecamonas trahens ATCC 50062]|uniref:Phospholipid/glycerol acyltransferase domain-containing protein n=1 Tax=Thecamonas trahens ATCC 50062 TaxID=461836 RepID=A0A0L0DQJ7_THETB|nr:hypothetical protein AMSG_10399 [Thecamonas trahens ATCC 50062]KNC54550.1 hypothetical protein AMSG_10399 [Thecamonas trahens ATCC 50062]|eukprot:XP_013753565.1 hypothetical protein AMSG_10399 [Thecamonas trahens ATCC 50062]